MRRWGYGLAGLLVFAIFVGANQSPEPEQTSQPRASQSQPAPESSSSAEPTEAQLESEDSVGSGSEEPIEAESTSNPSPAQTSTAAPTRTTQTPAPPEAAVDAEQTAQPSPTEAPSRVPIQEPSAAPTPEQTLTPSPAPTQTVAAPAPPTNIYEQLLSQLRIEDEVPSGYERELFRHWIDADGDGCDARREVLIAEAIEAPTVGSRCSLTGGRWFSAYDGVVTDDPSTFDIDHMVALKEAWDSGAHAWSSDRRRAFANDLEIPESLIAVTASSNRSKSDRDPADWLPPLSSYHCKYIRDWMVVKIRWELSVDPREFSAIRSVAAGC